MGRQPSTARSTVESRLRDFKRTLVTTCTTQRLVVLLIVFPLFQKVTSSPFHKRLSSFSGIFRMFALEHYSVEENDFPRVFFIKNGVYLPFLWRSFSETCFVQALPASYPACPT